MLFGIETGGRADPFAVGRLPDALPEGTYRLEGLPGDPALAALAWRLSGYRFGRYRERPAPKARLVAPEGVDAAEIDRIADAVAPAATSSTPRRTISARRRSRRRRAR